MKLRMVTRVAQLYHEDRLKQTEISDRLHVSQATVSRLLKRAEDEGVVRVTIVARPAPILRWKRLLRQRYVLRGGDRRRLFRGSGGFDPVGDRRGGGLLYRIDAERWRCHRHLVMERLAAAHGRRDPSDEAAARRAGRADPRRAWQSCGAEPRHAIDDAAGGADRRRAAAAAGAGRGLVLRRAAGDAWRRLRARRDRSVPPHDDRARRHRRASTLRHARQFRQRLHRRGAAATSPGAAPSATFPCDSSTRTARPCTGRSTSV